MPEGQDRSRFAIKIAGASGQGINTVGEILARALKSAGYSVFAYREYPSLIKGGHATYQIDFAPYQVSASTKEVDAVVVLNKQKTKWHLEEVRQNGLVFHDIDNPRINKQEASVMREKNIRLIYVPALRLATEVGGNELMTNIVSLGYLWKLIGQEYVHMEKVLEQIFGSKPQILEIDKRCLQQGYSFTLGEMPNMKTRLLQPEEISTEDKLTLHCKYEAEVVNFAHPMEQPEFADDILITGNEALAIGAINAGVRAHYAYPMTPSSAILDYLASVSHETGMIVKQAEDEITASAMALGSMFAGTRAMTATSGGGFDLMTEHISLAAIIEIPLVIVLGQRPGPATGLPTWTTQGDLQLAIFAGHGEFARAVIALGDAEDAFYSIQEAFNIAEKYQIPVIVLSDKLAAESNYSVANFDTDRIQIERGLVRDEAELAELKSTDRYALTETGISKRWLPGEKAADYNANSDEHDFEGNVTEEAEMAHMQIEKRLKKQQTLLSALPEPEIYDNGVAADRATAQVNFIGWGSSLGVMRDTLKVLAEQNIRAEYLHVKYMWPLRTERIESYLGENPETVILESNHNSQLAMLIKMETGLSIKNKLLKWDGRPFFIEDIIDYINKQKLT